MSDKSSTYVRCRTWQLFGAPLLPATGNFFMVLYFMFTYVAITGYGLSVATAAAVTFACKIIDTVSDPVIASLVPKVKTRFGSARPIMVFGYGVLAFSTIGILFIFPGMGLIPYSICAAGNILGRNLMNQAKNLSFNLLTTDPQQRPLLARAVQIYSLLATTVMSIYSSMVLFPKYGNISMGLLRELGLTMSIVGVIFVGIAVFAVREIDSPENIAAHYHPSVKINILDAFKMLFHNDALRVAVVSDATDKIANEVSGASVVVTLIFGVLIGNYEFQGSLSVYSTIISFILIFFVTARARRTGAGKAYMQYCWIACGVIVALFAFMLTGQYVNVSVAVVPTVIFVLLYSLLTSSRYATAACVNTMCQDIADYEFYLTGKYMPSLATAALAMCSQLFASLGSFISAALLAAMGYVTTAPQPGDPATPAVFWGTMVMWLGMLFLGWAISIVAMKFYPLTPKKMAEVQESNAKRLEENKSNAKTA